MGVIDWTTLFAIFGVGSIKKVCFLMLLGFGLGCGVKK